MISGLRQSYKLQQLLKAANLAKSTYFYHLKKQSMVDKYLSLKALITQIYHKHKGRYGYRRIAMTIKNLGYSINIKVIQRLMQQQGLLCKLRVKKYRSYGGIYGLKVANVLARKFKATAPNQKWATDVTEFKVAGNKLFLSSIIDLFNQEIISYQIETRPSFNLVQNMLYGAINKLQKHEKPMIHSDQGWQYQMAAYQQELESKELVK